MRALLVVLLICLSVSPGVGWADEPAQDDETANRVYASQLSDSSFLYETSIADLAQADSYYEGQTVLVSGEVVGDRVNDEFRQGNCWITLQDDEVNSNVVSVFMSEDQASVIDAYGHYDVRGTQLQVRGSFHLECVEHQGMSDIHAEEVAAIRKGAEYTTEPDSHIVGIALATCLLGVGLMVGYYIRREKMI